MKALAVNSQASVFDGGGGSSRGRRMSINSSVASTYPEAITGHVRCTANAVMGPLPASTVRNGGPVRRKSQNLISPDNVPTSMKNPLAHQFRVCASLPLSFFC